MTAVYEIISKLKASGAASEELKLTVHGFPIAIEKEMSDTATDKSEERVKQDPPGDALAEQPPPPGTHPSLPHSTVLQMSHSQRRFFIQHTTRTPLTSSPQPLRAHGRFCRSLGWHSQEHRQLAST